MPRRNDDKTLTRMIALRITEEQERALEAFALRDQRSVGAVVRRAIRELLEREEEKVA